MFNFFIFDENVLGKQKMQKMQKKLNFQIILRNRKENKVKFIKKDTKNKPILCLNYQPLLKTYTNGVHISLFHDNIVSKIPKMGLRTVSSHNLKEILYAIKVLKADVIFISPVFRTESHLETKPLGFIHLFKMINYVNFNKFVALGGMNERRLKMLKKIDFKGKIKGFAGIRFNLRGDNKSND